jgi:hypothetical protein
VIQVSTGRGISPVLPPGALASLLASGAQLTDELLMINALAEGYRGIVVGRRTRVRLPWRPRRIGLRLVCMSNPFAPSVNARRAAEGDE